MHQKTEFSIEGKDLYSLAGLEKIDAAFMDSLQEANRELAIKLVNARQHAQQDGQVPSELMLEIAPFFDQFLAQFLGIMEPVRELQAQQESLHKISAFKRHTLQKRILQKFRSHEWNGYSVQSFSRWINLEAHELLTAYQQAEANNNTLLIEDLENYMAWRCLAPGNEEFETAATLFDLPQPLHYDALFDFRHTEQGICSPEKDQVLREGFDLTDCGPKAGHAADHAHYCLKCHKKNKDSCSRGLRDKSDTILANPLGNMLNGCPLDQKISEMNQAWENGYPLAALAIITIDNPMVAATGYRICNDCAKACIFQKQTPVDVPSIETRILHEVLNLPWGFEIYSLLTRWNPFNFKQPLPCPSSGYSVLIAGMGPAGFTLAHYLLRNGHHVVGIDGLKIEPLPSPLTETLPLANRSGFELIYDIQSLLEPLSKRTAAGFGGVAEYGITARWDKNYLKIIRLILERQERFRLFGQVRFGGNLNLQKAKEMGFNHVALCLGAGKSRFLGIPGDYAKGVRAASDFLMSLQLTGAAREESLSNVQIRLPVGVIGGGLTAIDTATEALAFYPVQVKKFAKRYRKLCLQYGQEYVEKSWTSEDKAIAREFLNHARLLKKEHEQARKENRPPRLIELLQQWGGVTVLYRRKLQDAPAYRLNSDEVRHALAQGIFIKENVQPVEIRTDRHRAVETLVYETEDVQYFFNVKTLLIAAGTQPNTFYAREYPAELSCEGKSFRKQTPDKPFLKNSLQQDYVSAFGDLDPQYAGSVVKAMASAKKGYPYIEQVLKGSLPETGSGASHLVELAPLLTARLVAKEPLAPQLTKFIVKAPLACSSYQPGQFFKLQNFEVPAPEGKQAPLLIRSMAITPIAVDRAQGEITFVLSHVGASSHLARQLQTGDQLALMGPTGCPSAIPSGQSVLIMAQDFYVLLLLPVLHAMIAAHSTVSLYMPEGRGYEIAGPFINTIPGLQLIRHEDQLVTALPEMDHILVMGSESQMRHYKNALFGQHKQILKPDCQIVASINSPMQCMMKEICAQCIQKHYDPVTGEESVLYSCAYQDQPLKTLDLDMLKDRLQQNSLLEKISRTWVQ